MTGIAGVIAALGAELFPPSLQALKKKMHATAVIKNAGATKILANFIEGGRYHKQIGRRGAATPDPPTFLPLI